MATLGIKIFYLRTRQRRVSQQAAATALGVRQATLSHVERGKSLPALPLLVALCQYYDVSPTFLVDDARGVVPRRTERWSTRDALATAGMWIELPADRVRPTTDGKVLCPLLEGERFFDDEAAELRGGDGRAQLDEALVQQQHDDEALEAELKRELDVHPKRRGRV